jgi:hypothetical protein
MPHHPRLVLGMPLVDAEPKARSNRVKDIIIVVPLLVIVKFMVY